MDEEILDWEIDEEQHARRASMHVGDEDDPANDGDDVVSLGPDDDAPDYYHHGSNLDPSTSDLYAHDDAPRTAADQDRPRTPQSPSTASARRQHTPTRDSSSNSFRNGMSTSPSVPKGIHGLPPKPQTVPVPRDFRVPSSHPNLTSATAMSTRAAAAAAAANKTKSSSGNSSSGRIALSSEEPPLPPDWIPCESSSQKGTYFYNTRTRVTQWDRPTAPEALTYDDRHYRPGPGAPPPGPPRSSKRPYVIADSWTPGDGPPARTRARSPSPPPRRNRGDVRPAPPQPRGSRQGPANYDRNGGRVEPRSITPPPRRYLDEPPPPSPQVSRKQLPRQSSTYHPEHLPLRSTSLDRDRNTNRGSDANRRGGRRDRESPSPRQHPPRPRSTEREAPPEDNPTSATSATRRRSRFGPQPDLVAEPLSALGAPEPEAPPPSLEINEAFFSQSSDSHLPTSNSVHRSKRDPLPSQSLRFQQAHVQARLGRHRDPSPDLPSTTPSDVPASADPSIPSGPRRDSRRGDRGRAEPADDQNGPASAPSDLPRGPRAMQSSGRRSPAPPSMPSAHRVNGRTIPEGPSYVRAPARMSGTNNTPIGVRRPVPPSLPLVPISIQPDQRERERETKSDGGRGGERNDMVVEPTSPSDTDRSRGRRGSRFGPPPVVDSFVREPPHEYRRVEEDKSRLSPVESYGPPRVESAMHPPDVPGTSRWPVSRGSPYTRSARTPPRSMTPPTPRTPRRSSYGQRTSSPIPDHYPRTPPPADERERERRGTHLPPAHGLPNKPPPPIMNGQWDRERPEVRPEVRRDVPLLDRLGRSPEPRERDHGRERERVKRTRDDIDVMDGPEENKRRRRGGKGSRKAFRPERETRNGRPTGSNSIPVRQ